MKPFTTCRAVLELISAFVYFDDLVYNPEIYKKEHVPGIRNHMLVFKTTRGGRFSKSAPLITHVRYKFNTQGIKQIYTVQRPLKKRHWIEISPVVRFDLESLRHPIHAIQKDIYEFQRDPRKSEIKGLLSQIDLALSQLMRTEDYILSAGR